MSIERREKGRGKSLAPSRRRNHLALDFQRYDCGLHGSRMQCLTAWPISPAPCRRRGGGMSRMSRTPTRPARTSAAPRPSSRSAYGRKRDECGRLGVSERIVRGKWERRRAVYLLPMMTRGQNVFLISCANFVSVFDISLDMPSR